VQLSGNIYYRAYQTSDGYIAIGSLGPGPRARLQEALGIHDPRYDEGFDRSPDNLRAAGQQLMAEVEAIFRTRTNAEWLDYLQGCGVACGPVRFTDELWDDPQVVANGYVAEYDHTLLGPLRANAPIVRMSASPTSVRRAPPALGEHTDEVLSGIGYDAEEIACLREQGAID
jgi:crotonobetainyl-CoA:carnitine CoA-transferase CaiB-like acyl-CoA transferase